MQQPKKQPELIRKRIIEQAIILASENGTQAVSIQNVEPYRVCRRLFYLS